MAFINVLKHIFLTGSDSDLGEDVDVEPDKEKQTSEQKDIDSKIEEKVKSPKCPDDDQESLGMPEITKEPDILLSFAQEHGLEESADKDEEGNASDLSAVEQDLLNKAAEIQKTEATVEKEVEEAKVVKESRVESDSDTVGFVSGEAQSRQSQEKKSSEDESLSAIKVDGCKLEDTDLMLNKAADSKHDGHVKDFGKDVEPAVKSESQGVIDDRFEFKDEEDGSALPELAHEKDLKEKVVKGKVTEKEKSDGESEKSEKKTPKGRKKDVAKLEKKDALQKEPKREVKRGRPSLADKKLAAELLLQASRGDGENTEPPVKKMKEEKAEKERAEIMEVGKGEKDVESVDYSNEEMKKEENEVERKKVKKKVKKKEVEHTENATAKDKNTPKGGKGVCNKGKGKKQKEGDTEADIKALELGAVESLGRLGVPDIIQNMTPNTNAILSNPVINMDTCKTSESACHMSYSATDLLLKASQADVSATSESKFNNQDSEENSKEQAVSASALYDNTPPTTPEHDGEDANSQEHSQDSVSSSAKLANIHVVNERQYGSESPTGNASPSSNDGSIVGMNVACSESSNNEGQAATSLGKRRRESDEVTTAKRKRRGKSKQERKHSVKLPG